MKKLLFLFLLFWSGGLFSQNFNKGLHIILQSVDTTYFEENRQDFVSTAGSGVLHKAVHDADFRHGIVRSAGVSAQTFGVSNGSEENDGVAAQLNIGCKDFLLFRGQRRLRRVQCNVLVLMKRNGKFVVAGHRCLRGPCILN